MSGRCLWFSVALVVGAAISCSKSNEIDTSGTDFGDVANLGEACDAAAGDGFCGGGVCVAGRCRERCATDAECKGSICLTEKVGEAARGGCRFEGDSACSEPADCSNALLTCALDATCRIACSNSTPCPRNDQLCIEGSCFGKLEQGADAWSCDGRSQGEWGCEGASLQQCDVGGLGWVDTETCESAALCQVGLASGSCAPKACERGDLRCVGGEIQRCRDDLAGFQSTALCATPELCQASVDASSTSCEKPACGAGEYRCMSEALEVCNPARTGFDPVDTCATAELCDLGRPAQGGEGQCPAPACDPGELRCSEEELEVCNSGRTGYTLQETCASAALCYESLSTGACATPACTSAGENLCTGASNATLATCNDDLTGFDTIAACATAELCDLSLPENGGTGTACVTPACDEGEHQCEGTTLRACNAARTAFEDQDTCLTEGLCSAGVASGACAQPACEPWEGSCEDVNGTPTLFRCNSEQTGVEAVGESCGDENPCFEGSSVLSPARCLETIGPPGPSCTGGLICNSVDCCRSKLVPGGNFPLGRSEAGSDACPASTLCGPDEQPEHDAVVAAYYLDEFEVTVGRFRRFVEAYTGQPPAPDDGAHPLIPGSGWQAAFDSSLPGLQDTLISSLKCNSNYQTWTDNPGAYESYPINCVSWFTAFAFCIWDGGRLPTEAEWEFAAAGGAENRLYPWGSAEPDATRANYNDNASMKMNVGSFPDGAGRWGHKDLAGGLWEWVLDYYRYDWYSTEGSTCVDCANLDLASFRVSRGADWNSSWDELRATMRDYINPTNKDDSRGFRCVRSP
jgi:formylglycine-generating enzyme required for sulfatase activity